MKNEKHTHEPIATGADYGFSTPTDSREPNPAAHGNIEHTEQCSCGATRRVLVNGNHIEYGKWQAPKWSVVARKGGSVISRRDGLVKPEAESLAVAARAKLREPAWSVPTLITVEMESV